MELKATRFGDVKYDDSDTIRMVREFLGFEHLKQFIVVSLEGQEPFRWFQSIEDRNIAFLMIDPLFFKPDYLVDITPGEMAALQTSSLEDIALFVLVSIPTNQPEKMTANLQGPLAINMKDNCAAQLVLSESDYSPEHSIFEEIDKRLAEAAT
jgi:flagellar assembly factor FliW